MWMRIYKKNLISISSFQSNLKGIIWVDIKGDDSKGGKRIMI